MTEHDDLLTQLRWRIRETGKKAAEVISLLPPDDYLDDLHNEANNLRDIASGLDGVGLTDEQVLPTMVRWQCDHGSLERHHDGRWLCTPPAVAIEPIPWCGRHDAPARLCGETAGKIEVFKVVRRW